MGSYCTSELQAGLPKEMVCKLSSCRVSIKATLVTFIGMISAETQDKNPDVVSQEVNVEIETVDRDRFPQEITFKLF